ncbi:hypothetical protein PRNP1_010263 [Phytophthora ramorum]
MSTYTKFAIIGAGGVGGTVADELLKKGDAVSVAILTRDESKSELPAEYGARVTEGPNAAKQEVQDLLTQHQIPFTIFYTGLFAEILPHFLDYHYADGYMNVSALEGAKIAFEAERLSPLQIRDLVEKKLDKKIEVHHVDYEANKKKVDTGDFVVFITTLFEEGHGVVGTEQEVQEAAAKFFPDWNPAPYESFIA